MQTRRELLKGLIVGVGGATLLSACNGIPVVASSNGATRRFYTRQEWEFISRLSDLLLPRTETPGALDVNVPGFMDGLISEWASAATQRSHRESLAEIDGLLHSFADGDFLEVPISTAEAALREFDAQAFINPSDREFSGYRTLKGLIYNTYMATEGGATEELQWVATPGRWDPSVPVS